MMRLTKQYTEIVGYWHQAETSEDMAKNIYSEVAQLEDALGEIKQIASQRGLDSQATYDFVLEDIEDRCLKALGVD